MPDDPKFTKENPPKTADEWNSLRDSDSTLFLDLTQDNVNRLTRENKEKDESIVKKDGQINNLTVELNQKPVYTPPNLSVTPEPPVVKEGEIDDNTFLSGKATDADWENLAIDNPTKHADLRYKWNQQTTNADQNLESAQASGRQVVFKEHPDMFMPELDASGNPVKDAEGKTVLKVDPKSGEPIFNLRSEKGIIWNEIYAANPNIENSPDSPTMLMSEMERRLRGKGQAKVEKTQAERDADEQALQEKQVAQGGTPPPPPPKEFKYSTKDEEETVKKSIARGTFKDEAEYFATKEDNTGFAEEGRMPTFGGKPAT